MRLRIRLSRKSNRAKLKLSAALRWQRRWSGRWHVEIVGEGCRVTHDAMLRLQQRVHLLTNCFNTDRAFWPESAGARGQFLQWHTPPPGNNDNDVIGCNLPGRTPMFTEFRNMKRNSYRTYRLTVGVGYRRVAARVGRLRWCGTTRIRTTPPTIRGNDKESLQVYAPEVTRANRERFRPLAGLLHVISKLGVNSSASCRVATRS